MTEVYSAISAVSKELAHDGISKDRSNQQQGYKFRGIDDCLNALAALLPEHNLVIIPSVLEREVIERQTKSGGSLFYVTVKVQFGFICTKDGSRHDAVVYGEAMDSADKATNKAMSAAYKYAVLLTFCIPTEGDNDADAVTHDVVAKQTANIKAVQDKLQAAKAQPAAAPSVPTMATLQDTSSPVAQEKLQASQAQPTAFVWQIGKTHGGKRIEEIPLDYLEWYVANGKKADHVAACKAELQRVQSHPKISALCEAYLENISVSETVMECQRAIDAALSDENINVFEQTHIKEAGERKMVQLRQSN